MNTDSKLEFDVVVVVVADRMLVLTGRLIHSYF
jgi:hypothetical protein